MWDIRLEEDGDAAAVEALVDRGFGPGRFAKTAYRLREGVAPDKRLSLVAVGKDGALLSGALLAGRHRRRRSRCWAFAIEPACGKGIWINPMQQGIERAAPSNRKRYPRRRRAITRGSVSPS